MVAGTGSTQETGEKWVKGVRVYRGESPCPKAGGLYPTRIPSSEMRPLTKGREEESRLFFRAVVESFRRVCRKPGLHLNGERDLSSEDFLE